MSQLNSIPSVHSASPMQCPAPPVKAFLQTERRPVCNCRWFASLFLKRGPPLLSKLVLFIFPVWVRRTKCGLFAETLPGTARQREHALNTKKKRKKHTSSRYIFLLFSAIPFLGSNPRSKVDLEVSRAWNKLLFQIYMVSGCSGHRDNVRRPKHTRP